MKKSRKTYIIKTVTRLLSHYCEPDASTGYSAHCDTLEREIHHIDLGLLFWRDKLEPTRLLSLHRREAETADGERGLRAGSELDGYAIRYLPEACAIFGAVKRRMPGPDELWFAFRVLSRAISVGTRHETGFKLHMARGLVTDEYNQYDIDDLLEVASDPLSSSFGRYVEPHLARHLKRSPEANVVINVRNDGEFNQALIVAAILKSLNGRVVVILDTSDANEQFDFGSWLPSFVDRSAELGKYIDYFLPRQDYKATLRHLLDRLDEGESPIAPEPNLVPLGGSCAQTEGAEVTIGGGQKPRLAAGVLQLIRPSLDSAFEHYLQTLPVFYAAGLRSMSTRISPNRCHWAACSFCTINAQHILPRAGQALDPQTEYFISNLLDIVQSRRVESLIITDEALPPQVLFGFARGVLDRKLSIVYRARARFSPEMTPEASELLYRSGCRYLGLGLEAASPRVNQMVNKHMGTPIDYGSIVDGLESAGIRSHIYCIMGFPTETREEIEQTADFIAECIERHPYVTVSANIFHLMKGSEIYRNPAAFGITEVIDRGALSLASAFHEPVRDSNLQYAYERAQSLYNRVFLPQVHDPESAEAYWHFVDQTGIFYLEKVHYSTNPYRAMARAAEAPLPEDFGAWYFAPSRLVELRSASGDGLSTICDLVTNNYTVVHETLSKFVLGYDPEATFEENLSAMAARDQWPEYATAFRELFRAGFFRRRGERVPSSPGDSAVQPGRLPAVCI